MHLRALLPSSGTRPLLFSYPVSVELNALLGSGTPFHSVLPDLPGLEHDMDSRVFRGSPPTSENAGM